MRICTRNREIHKDLPLEEHKPPQEIQTELNAIAGDNKLKMRRKIG